MAAGTHSDWLIDQMGAELRKDLEPIILRVKRANSNPEVRARLMFAAASFMFGAACGAQADVAPGDRRWIAESLAADMVDTVAVANEPLLYP